jgi:hypothetical protein
MFKQLRRLVVALAVVTAAMAVTASATMAVPIPGNPMTVDVGPQGQLQGFVSGGSSGIYFAPEEEFGDAGFFLAFPAAGSPPSGMGGQAWGFTGSAGPYFGGESGEEGTEYEPIAQSPVTGSGTAADPLSQVTEYKAGGVKVAQTTTYVNGTTEFKIKWVVSNGTAAAINFRALVAADFYFEGDDRGTGVFTQGPPRFIGGTNVDSGRSGGFVEAIGGASPPWSHYQEMAYPDIWTNVIEEAAEPTVHFNDTVEAEDVDNAGGVEWDQYETTTLAKNASATFELTARVGTPAALQLEPTNAGSPQGVPIHITGTAVDSSGVPYAGRTLRYAITGANPGSGALTLGSDGKASITDPGTNAGNDTIAAFVDFNNNGVRDPSEPQASALATFIDSVPPSCSVSIKGDRPGGKGGAGNALEVSITCGEPATMSLATTLTLPPTPLKKHGARISKAHKKKPKTVKLPVTTATVKAGVATPVSIKVPKNIANKYAGRTLTAKVVATVKDSAGNVAKAEKTSPIKLPKKKKKGKKHHRGH